MARSRNIKPGFFENDTLAEVNPLGRLLFIALWTIADREGRLEYRPRRIKAECLPYDDCNVENLLEELFVRGFIVLYEVENIKYIQIVNFKKHQNPHLKEQPSTIPAPDLHQTCTIQARLIPDSLLLIPDSPSPHTLPQKDVPAIAGYEEDFEALWTGWKDFEMPKGDKAKARDSYGAALKMVDAQTIKSMAERYNAECRKFKIKTKHVVTWLNLQNRNKWEAESEDTAEPENRWGKN